MKSLIAFAAVAAVSSTCLAQCSASHIPVNEELKDAGTTMIATVEGAAPVADSSFHLDGVDYVVHVDRVLKGHMITTDVTHIFSENSPTKFPMQVGKQYVLFVHRNYNTYEVDNCGNSAMLQPSTQIRSVAQLKEFAKNPNPQEMGRNVTE